MKAFQMTAHGTGAVTDVADPVPAQGELLLAPVVSGVCSTDVHVYLEAALQSEVPLVLGHESVATVLESRAGTGAGPYGSALPAVGDVVTVEPLFPCRACRNCSRGLLNLCLAATHMGITRDGCFAELYTAPAWRATVLPPDLPPARGILVEPLACAVHFVDLAGVRAGNTLVVLGAGPAGLLTAAVGVASGVSVLVSDPAPARRDLALRLGVAAAVHPDELADTVATLTHGVGPDAVIEVTGVPAAMTQAFDVAPRGGTVVLTGVCGRPQITVDSSLVVLKELNVRGAAASRNHFGRATRLIAERRVDVERLEPRQLDWTQADEALHLAQHDHSIGKLLLMHE